MTSHKENPKKIEEICKGSIDLVREIEFSRLVENFLNVIHSFTSSKKIAIILADSLTNEFLIQGLILNAKESILQDCKLDDCDNICVSIIKESLKSKKEILIDNLSQYSRFKLDSYLKTNSINSIWCLPMVGHGKVLGALYLEEMGQHKDLYKQCSYFLDLFNVALVNSYKFISLEQKNLRMRKQQQLGQDGLFSILKGMRQGFISIRQDGNIGSQYSQCVENIFEEENITQQNAIEFLFKKSSASKYQKDQCRKGLLSMLGQDALQFDFNKEHLINEIVLDTSGQKKYYRIDWMPCVNKETNRIESMNLFLNDLTSERSLGDKNKNQLKEMKMIEQMASLGADRVNRFFKSSDVFIKTNHELINDGTEFDEKKINTLFRNLHTVKGNAKSYELTYLVELANNAENTYDYLRKNKDVKADINRLVRENKEISDCIEHYLNLFKSKLSSLTQKENLYNDQSLVIHKINQLLQTKKNSEELVDEIQKTIKLNGATKLTDVCKDIEGSAKTLAKALQIPTPKIEIVDNDIYFVPQIGETIRNVIMHCLRNSLDHGIERPEIRKKKGKPEEGKITIISKIESDGIVLYFQDDGAGLNINKLKKKGIDRGFISKKQASDKEIAELIFRPGITTAEKTTIVSGRGVGMDAAREFLKKQGGDIYVEFSSDSIQDGKKTFEFRILLPKKFVVGP